jgi:hypothetical protein
MNPNPYQAPQAPGPPGAYPYPPAGPPADRTMFVLAAVGAGLASAYWAGLTLLIGLGAAYGSVSAVQIILPVVLIVLYAVRGVQIFNGDRAAARRILWLHGFGAVSALLQIASGGALFFVLQGIKILIHIFGGITAYLVQKSA